jgi:hypothetical protein
MFIMVVSALSKLFKRTQGFQRSPVLRALAMDGEGTQSFVQHELTFGLASLFFLVCCHVFWEIIHSQFHTGKCYIQWNFYLVPVSCLCSLKFTRSLILTGSLRTVFANVRD